LYGKVQVGAANVPDGTLVTAWMSSSEAVTATAPLTFPTAGVKITFSSGCDGNVTVAHQAGKTQTVSEGEHASVYSMDVLGPTTWTPADPPTTEGQTVTVKISNTVVASTTWTMGATVALTLATDALTDEPPPPPADVVLLDQAWDIHVDCTEFVASVTFTYQEASLHGIAEGDIVGMARYDEGYNRWEHVTGTVNSEANTVTVEDVTSSYRWRILASSPPKPVTGLHASRSGAEVTLHWSAVLEDIRGQTVGDVTYNVYRAVDSPYFSPGGTPYATLSDTTFVDTSAPIHPTAAYYYAITATEREGTESALSDRLGAFAFKLHDTTGTDYNWIALPLHDDVLIMASDLGQHIEDHSSVATKVRSVAYWDGTAQQLVECTLTPTLNGDFALQGGRAYRVEVEVEGGSTTAWPLTGIVPRKAAVHFDLITTPGTDYTWISLPLDQTGVQTSADVAQAVAESSNTTVLSLCRWNAVGQQFTCYTTLPIPMGDFAVLSGHPYRLETDTSGVWP
jgi:hypothetical protein